jgi:hypothetical protein
MSSPITSFTGGTDTLSGTKISLSGGGTYTTTSINATDSYISFTGGTSTLTVREAIRVDLLMVGGGGGSGPSRNNQSGGAGGIGGSGGSGHVYEVNNFILPSGTYNVTIGAGGSTYTNSAGDGWAGNGGTTQIVYTSGVTLLAIAGGGGGVGSQNGNSGNTNKINNYSAGGGGGSGWIGSASGFGISGNANGLQGGGAIPGSTSNAGKSSSITGTSVIYGGGGILGNNTLLTAYGAGANSPTNGNSTGFVGNSGVVIIRYRVADNNTITNSTNLLVSGTGTFSTINFNDTMSCMLFTSGVSTLTVSQSVIADVLIVGGGGGGGSFGGGGGAGAVLYTSNFTIPIGTHTISVGAGGAGGSYNTNGINGNNTIFSINGYIYNALGGGGGGGRNESGYIGRAGNDGGSGGGGSHSDSSTTINIGGLSLKNIYTNWTSLGNNGGEGKDGASDGYGSAGGGGAGSIGANGTTNAGGNGGSGINLISMFGSNVGDSGWFAGGGGGAGYRGTNGTFAFGNGGNGLLGGAGNSFSTANGGNGIANTGGGGGGADFQYTGGTGGSGVVIIKFRTQSLFSSVNLITSGSGTSTLQQINSTDSYISFTSGISTLQVTNDITVDLLLVGGGGGGGNGVGFSDEAGGGGAGGVVYMVSKTLPKGMYTISVGSGGAANTNGNDTTIAFNNSELMFDNIRLIARGGGKGASGNGNSGGSGGSGGGGCHYYTSGGTATQGNTFWNGSTYVAGGYNGAAGIQGGGGGGGGAGEVGNTDGTGYGGDGVSVNITGSSVFYAGGGNAYPNTTSTRSDGGGGLQNGTANDSIGLPNTGGGGGGGYTYNGNQPGGAGGSGIVIIRFKNADNIINNVKYLTYTTSGSVVFNAPTVCDVLLVGGGGGGGSAGQNEGGGGGGGGGVGVGKILFKPNITYTITIGNGGAQNTAGGNTSIVGDIINEVAFGGGNGGAQTGGNGGSGGGAGGYMGAFFGGRATFGSSTSTNNTSIIYYGNDGGLARQTGGSSGGGGGETMGISCFDAAGKNGGTGFLWIFNNTRYGGGGGGGGGYGNAGGAGGAGGGANGGNSYGGIGGNATANTGGGGGGGASNWSAGGSGGSGIVIIRFSLVQTTGERISTVYLSNLRNTLNITEDNTFTILKDASNADINPAAWYKFENSTAIGSDSMNSFTLTSSGSSVAYSNLVTIKGTGSLYLTGGWITGTGVNLNNKNFSISVWIYRTSAVDCNIYASDGNYGGYITFIFGWYSTNWIYVNYYGPEVTYNDTTLNEWVHYTYTYNITGYVMKLYRNGVLVATNTSGTQVFNTGSSTTSYSIGRRYGGVGAQASGNNMYLSDFRIYTNLELSQSQINTLYRGNINREYRLSNFRNKSPNATSTQINLSDHIASKRFMGLIGSNPAKNALDIKNNTGLTVDGNYYISCNNTPILTYCLMQTKYDGGGWMMIMKATRSATFNYEANYWTTINTLNERDLTINDSDAKYDAFNHVPIKDVMAIWPDIANDFGNSTGGSLNISDGWVWLVNNYYNNGGYPKALDGFQLPRDANPSNPYSFAGFRSGTFSTQSPAYRHVFGGHSHIGNNNWGTVRWGFVWNENGANDFNSCDAWNGIGVSRAFAAFGNTGKSAGDNYGCCGSAALNREMKVRLYGR